MTRQWQFSDVPGAQVKPIRVALSQQHDGHDFPLIVTNESTASKPAIERWVTANRRAIEQANQQIGAILFRGFDLQTDRDFDRFIRLFELPNFTYAESLSNAVRVNRTERVFTANEAPPEVNIVMHHEMAQTPLFPSRLLFFCEQAADKAGQTPLCRSDILFERLETEFPEFAADCETKGLRYTVEMPDQADALSGQGRSWRSTLNAESREDAEAKLRGLNYGWRWLPDGSLRATTPLLPAVRKLDSGKKTFFNQLISAAYGWKPIDGKPAVTFGDATELPTDALERAAQLAEALAFDTPWQTGDAVMINNYLVMHGRRPFQGTRKVLASLVG